jgi:hypothetical protein
MTTNQISPMDENTNVAPDELKAEQEALAETKEDEIKAKVIEKYGLDELEHESLIENLVTGEIENRKKLSQAIAQKRKYREQAQVSKPASDGKTLDADELLKKATEVVEQKFEQRDLNDLGLPDSLKAEVQKIAKAQGVSVRQAAADPYIVFKKQEYEKEQKTNEAAISRTNKSAATVGFSIDSPPDVDMSTEEGQKKWDEYVKFLQKNQK